MYYRIRSTEILSVFSFWPIRSIIKCCLSFPLLLLKLVLTTFLPLSRLVVIFFFLWHCCLNSGPMLARPALYHWSHTSSLLCSGYFEDKVSLFALTGLDHDPPILFFCCTGMICAFHHAQLFYLENGSVTHFLPGLAWNPSPLYLCLPCILR
jgi:hypothetical protein